MEKHFNRTVAMVLLLTMVIGFLPAMQVCAATDTSAVGMVIDSFKSNNMTFSLNEESRIFVVSDTEPTGELLQTVQLIQRQFAADQRPSATPMPIAWGAAGWAMDGDIVIHLDTESDIGAEGYRLEVTNVAEICVSDLDGLIYGANMLLKHLRYADSNSIQGFTAADAPDTKQRAVSLDCGRKYYTKNWICNFIREISWMGYNTLELHFSDDSGFRVDLWDEAYYTENYQPANDFTWICGSNYTSWTLDAYKNDPDKGKYLTTAELVEILEVAKEYHIDIIPAFDSPSHLDYLTWTYEQNYLSNPEYAFYSTYDNTTYYAKDVGGCINYTNSSGWSTPLRWPYYSTIDITAKQDKAFIFELYIDIANFFKEYGNCTDFSIGADEVNLSTSNLASGYSFAWGFADFVVYINELNTLLNDKGYTMRMYNDFMGNTSYKASTYNFADNIEILYWDSPFDPATGSNANYTEPVSYYVDKGATLYNCIQTNTYYALRVTGSGSDARSVKNRQWTFYHANEEDIFDEWYPADISEHGDYSEDVADVPAENLGGAYFLIWGDYACVSTEQEIWNGVSDKSTGEFYSLRDRMWSNISKMWNWDLNSAMTFSQFTAARDAYGDFPGAGTKTTSCSEETVLPAATEPLSGYVGGCTRYAAYGQIQIASGTSVMNMPCTNAVEASAIAIEAASKGDVYTATGIFENTVGELWYKVKTNDGLLGYIKSTDTRYLTDLMDDISITAETCPSAHVAGSSFTIAGDIVARYNALTEVEVAVTNGFAPEGETVVSARDTVTDNSYSLLNSDIDNGIAFGSIPLGEHTYAINVSYVSYYADGDTLVSGGGDVVLVDYRFMVIAKAGNQSTCPHTYSETVVEKADCQHAGVSIFACTTCGYVYETVVEDGGHEYASEPIGATCSEFEKVRYTCTLCGYSYVTYPDHLLSQWQDALPNGVDMSLVETKKVYRYADKDTVTSYETSMDGYTQVSSQWVSAGTGSVQYVNSWPSGFSTANSLYSQYNNKSQKVTAFENETSKRVINKDAVSGYLYYHWCYARSYYSLSVKSGSYTTFHAYYSTTSPNNYACDTSDYSYKTSHSTCSNSNWFFVTYVYTQSYTDYNKEFTYERWSDWSDWSETPVQASDNRKVEEKTLYRYVDGTYEPHVWTTAGVCGQCGAQCPHNYKNNICLDCTLPKPEYDYYLFGWINGANYACEDKASELGEYKFVDGQLVLMFAQDSYVGIKASDNQSYYMTDGWQGFVSNTTVYNTKKLSNPDKLFVPGGTEVTFTLVDNGDDTYQLSYVAVKCDHISHSAEGYCTICGAAVEHAFQTDGFCICGTECDHDMKDGYCSVCGKECDHAYKNNVCGICGMSKPVQDYYLFGYINGANYGCEEDYMNLGQYKFVDGKVVVKFTVDSYVAIKSADNAHWYMTEGWLGQVTSATLYNTKKLAQADKLYVPAGKLVTFTLVDNGDDTYVLSYEAVCTHDHHGQDGLCTTCGEKIIHSYQDNVCTHCGFEKPVQDYYLFGYINGADYADKADKDNLGVYKFVDGKLVVFFTVDSYVGVKSADNENWYMTDGYQEGKTAVVLVNSETILTEDKLFVPSGFMVTFTLVDNGDDTYQLSYVAEECPHEIHDANQICKMCGEKTKHRYENGVCHCGASCEHAFNHGTCLICGLPCDHVWAEGICRICLLSCSHDWNNGVCNICSMVCSHNWIDGECSICGLQCIHEWDAGQCVICSYQCRHNYVNNHCAICDFTKPAVDYYLFGTINGEEYAWGQYADQLGEYKFVNGKLVATFHQDSYIGLKASQNVGWYMTDGDQGSSSTVVLANTANITNGTLLKVPGCMTITFTLIDNGNDTLTLSYEAVPCLHESHDLDGKCVDCATEVGHSYVSVITPATCTSDGYTTHSCEVCGDSYTSDPVVAFGHSWVDATCTEVQYCATCGERVGRPLGHNLVDTVIKPTCTSGGYTIQICTRCNGSFISNPVNPTGHSWSGATCTSPITCTSCGATTGEAIGHTYNSVITEPSCTEDGYTTHTCLSCGNSYIDNIVSATGHSWMDATCTEPSTCSVCGTTSESALGHSYVSVTKKASCTEDGYTTHTCSICQYSYVDERVSAYGHKWVEATCTEAKTCSVCGEVSGEALGHSYKSVVTQATCTEDGYTTYTCSACGNSYVDNRTDATGHNWEKGTCTNCGLVCEHDYQSGVCSQCGKKEPVVMLSYPSLSFEDEILYNVYYTLQDIDVNDVAEMGLITFASRLEHGTMADALKIYSGYISDSSIYMVQTAGIPAKNMADTVYFKVYAQMTDGTYIYSQVAGYNAVAYANTVLKTNDVKAKALVVAMLNYGAAAQEYFDYNTDQLMNASLTEEQLALVDAYDESMVSDIVPADKSKVGSFVMDGGYSDIYPTVSFNGAFSINYYFANTRTTDDGLTFYYWDAKTYASVSELRADNATGTIKMVQDGKYWFAAVDGIAAKDMDKTVYVAAVYTSNGLPFATNVIAYSLGRYCETIAANGDAFGAATAVYGYYAGLYLANN